MSSAASCSENQLASSTSTISDDEQSPATTAVSTDKIVDSESLIKCNGVVEIDQCEVNCGESVGIYWNIEDLEPNELDFIGMFKSSEGAPIDIDSLIDHRLRGCTSAHSGNLTWMIEHDKFNEHEKTEVCFCYYDHLNVLRARSSTLTVINQTADSAIAPTAPSSDAAITKQQSEDVPVVNKPPRRQTSDPQGLSVELTKIRQTLYSSGLHPQRPASSTPFRRHTSLYTPQRSHDFTTSMVVPRPQFPCEELSSLTESLPPNWEVRTSETGTLMYYDHEHKVVKLDKPDETTGNSSPGIEDFLRRSNRNLLQRQLSNPTFQNEKKSNWTRSNTVSGAVRSQHLSSNKPPPPPAVKVVQPDKQNSETTNDSDSKEVDDSTTEAVDQQMLHVPGPGERARKQGILQDDNKVMERLHSRQDSINEDLRRSPGFMFITRPDLYKFAKEAKNDEFFKNLAVLELIQTIRSDHSLYAKYQHSSKLVKVVNTFAQTECELPDGWEKKVDPKTRKLVYIDHNTRQTSYIDPRLPFPGNDLTLTSVTAQAGLVSRTRPFVAEASSGQFARPRLPSSFNHPGDEQARETRSASFSSPMSSPGGLPIPGTQIPHPPAPPPSLLTPPTLNVSDSTVTQEDDYSDRVVRFLQQPNIFDLLSSRYEASLSVNLISAIHDIQSQGREALEQMQNEMDSLYLELTIILSLFEEEIAHFIFPVSRSASMLSTSSHSSSSHTLPPPNPELPEPLPHQPDTNNEPPTLNMEDMTFAGVPVATIGEFFNRPNVYHHILSQFDGVSSEHREFVQWFENRSQDEINDRLCSLADENFRQFVFHLSSRMIEQPLSPSTSAAANNETDDSSHETVSNTLTESETHNGATPATSRSFPSVELIKRYFDQSNIYAIVIQHLGVITMNDRATIERIRTTEMERLDERLLWDTAMTRFIMRFSDAIYEYDEPVVRLVTPSLETPLAPPPLPPLSSLKKSAQKRQFIDKLSQLQRTLIHNGYADSSYSSDCVSINRDQLLRDAYEFIMGKSAKSLRKRPCSIRWNREEGLDYGGPQREFFFRLSRQLFNPYYGLFEYSAHGSYTVQISAQSALIGDALQWFRFAGRLVGYAIIQGHLLDVFFARHVYKDLLGRSYSISDVEALDISFHNSLNYVLKNDPEPLELMFTVLEETFGEASEYELKPGGAHIAVTEENKMEYLELMVQWRLSRGVKQQTESFIKGFKEMIPRAYLKNFDPQELEWVIAGTPEIDMDDWKNNTVYWGGYYKDHKVIKWFWETVESYTTEQKLRLLQFVTGTSSIPFEGFKALRGSSSLQKFTIDTMTGINAMFSLPIAHTCFNRLDLPEYLSKETLYEKLTLAIEECGTFENA